MLGSLSKLCILVRMAATSYVGLHLFCNMSRHSSPVPYTLGWNIVDTNLTPGGLLGYASSNCMTNLNVPSSNGVSAGPMITAFLVALSVKGTTGTDLVALPGHYVVGDG